MARHPLLAACGSATNFFSIGATLLAITAGSLITAVIFALVTVIGTYNKWNSLKGNRTPGLLLFKPEITATALMIAAAMGAATQFLVFFGMLSGNETLGTLFPPTFSNMYAHLATAIGWLTGAIGDHYLKVNDRALFASKGHRLAKAIHNPSLWYAVTNMAFTFAALYFEHSYTDGQLGFAIASFTCSFIALAYSTGIALTRGLTGPITLVNYMSSAAALMTALQTASGALPPYAVLFLVAHLFFAWAHIAIIKELRAAQS